MYATNRCWTWRCFVFDWQFSYRLFHSTNINRYLIFYQIENGTNIFSTLYNLFIEENGIFVLRKSFTQTISAFFYVSLICSHCFCSNTTIKKQICNFFHVQKLHFHILFCFFWNEKDFCYGKSLIVLWNCQKANLNKKKHQILVNVKRVYLKLKFYSFNAY